MINHSTDCVLRVRFGGKVSTKPKLRENPMITKPVYPVMLWCRITQTELLKKCLHSHAQNPNESFNNIVWAKVSKRVFVRLHTLKLDIYDAALSFNEGHCSKLDLYKKTRTQLQNPSTRCVKWPCYDSGAATKRLKVSRRVARVAKAHAGRG